MINTDFLIIGSGISGLSYALKVASHFPDASVTILTKGDQLESNTKYAQGGIAVVLDNQLDSFESHIEDTLIAGDGLCDENIVRKVVTEGPQRLKELISWGTDFDKGPTGNYDLGREGGHSYDRIIHHKDSTGLQINSALLSAVNSTPNIKILSHYFAIDLITEHHFNSEAHIQGKSNCYGIYALNLENGAIIKIFSRITLLATGGGGQVYKNTTNPLVATGDGIAMAYRAGAEIKNMEFVQFHPTLLYNPRSSTPFLISEAVRGFGAILKTTDGKPFLHKYDPRKELASRDIVARAIDREMKMGGEKFTYLDCRHLDQKEFKTRFPNISQTCLDMGLDLSKDMIPVVPASHYLCGGVTVNEYGKTSINNLYASGECTYTGLHGANRLASNSLLEALVYSHRCYLDSVKHIEKSELGKDIPDWRFYGTTEPKEKVLITHNRAEVQNLMSDYVGIVRSNERLTRAMNRLNILYKETKMLYDNSVLSLQLCELRNIINVAYLIVTQSLARKENKGGFYNIDLE